MSLSKHQAMPRNNQTCLEKILFSDIGSDFYYYWNVVEARKMTASPYSTEKSDIGVGVGL